MEFIRVREYLNVMENKKEIKIEDVLFLISGFSEDISLLDLPVENSQVLSKYLRQWANLIKMLVQLHKDELTVETGFNRLEKICNFLEKWETEVISSEKNTKEEIFDINEYLSEKENDEEKFVACTKLQSTLDEHTEFLQNINNELAYKKKKLAIDMLQME